MFTMALNTGKEKQVLKKAAVTVASPFLSISDGYHTHSAHSQL